jgi:glucan phosphoethanolaminetransferase (alkaline phosphatase superfamily)
MSAIILGLLWALFWCIVLAGVVYLVLYGINKFIYELPEKLVQGVWFLFLLLCIIALVTVFAGGGGGSATFVPHFR